MEFSHLGEVQEAVTDPQPKHPLLGLWYSPVQLKTSLLKEVALDPTRVVDSTVVSRGTANNSNRIWHVLTCVVYNKKK